MTTGRACSVLVVEDDVAIREQVRELLEAEGLSVAEAGHGQEALTALRDGLQPSLVLLDLMMPVMDGWSLLEALQADAAWRGLPVLVASASPDLRPVDAPMLHKPFSVRALLQAIQDQLDPPAATV